MELTFENFCKSKNEEGIWNNFFKYLGRDTIWKKIAFPKTLTRKRFVKIMMATGMQRDAAQHKADCVLCSTGCYKVWYHKYAPYILYDIQNNVGIIERILLPYTGNKELLKLAREFDEKCKKEDDAKMAKMLKKEFLELKEIAKQHPECTDLDSCNEFLTKMVIENSDDTGEIDENGKKIFLLREENKTKEYFKTFEDVRKLRNFYEYLEEE